MFICVAWVGLRDGTGWGKVLPSMKTCLPVNTVSDEDIPVGMTHHSSRILSAFGGKTCYLTYLSEFCSKMLSELRSYLCFFAAHRGSVILEVSKVISYYFLFSDLLGAKTPF